MCIRDSDRVNTGVPAGLQFLNATISSGVYAHNPISGVYGTVFWSIGAMDVGEERHAEFEYNVTAASGTEVQISTVRALSSNDAVDPVPVTGDQISAKYLVP